MTIILVGCGKKKLERAAEARDLYTGELFKKARAWAERHGDQWFILSALHGLTSPGERLAPYDVSMRDLLPREKSAWGFAVRQELMRLGLWDAEIVFLAGREYEGAVLGAPNVVKPLEGMEIGQRLSWLKRELA